MNPENAIEIRDMSKSFMIQSDRAKSLKDMILFFNRRNPRTDLNVLNHINVDIKKVKQLLCWQSQFLTVMENPVRII